MVDLISELLDNPCETWSLLENAVEGCDIESQEICDVTSWIIDQGKGGWVYDIGICANLPNVSRA